MSQHLTDWYSYSHVLHGIIFYWLLSVFARGHLSVGARLVIAMFVEAGWEILEFHRGKLRVLVLAAAQKS